VRESLRRLAGPDQSLTEIVQRLRIVWILLDRLSETLDGAVQIACCRRRLNGTGRVEESSRDQSRTGGGVEFSSPL
jgi:hypothetical protein